MDEVSFLCLPPTWWVDDQARAVGQAMGRDASEAVIAAYFVAYLDWAALRHVSPDVLQGRLICGEPRPGWGHSLRGTNRLKRVAEILARSTSGLQKDEGRAALRVAGRLT